LHAGAAIFAGRNGLFCIYRDGAGWLRVHYTEGGTGLNDAALWVVTRTWPLDRWGQGVQMMRAVTIPFLGALATLATAGSTFAISTYPQIAQAQTQGMERRDERRDTRQGSREVKHECNAGQGNSRSECRQAKHQVKQTGRSTQNP
jgi:hypothetical protein